MNHYEVEDVKRIRKKVGITQSELAKLAGVSQSLIAKVESGKIDPTFSNMKKIFAALNSVQKKESLKAKDFIHKGVVSCKSTDTISNVIKKMKKHEISQLPVKNDSKVVGVVSESRLLDHLLQGKNRNCKVKEIMEEVPPIVNSNTGELVLSNLLKYFPLVLVQDKGNLKGVVTRSDILRKVYG